MYIFLIKNENLLIILLNSIVQHIFCTFACSKWLNNYVQKNYSKCTSYQRASQLIIVSLIMNKLVRFLLLAGFILLNISVLAQQSSYPTKQINGKEFYIYTVQQGEGLFSISRRFEVTQAEINTLNPEIQNGLKAGQKILIPVVKKVVPEQKSTTQTKAEEKTQTKPENTNNQEFITHTVKKRQTLFAISRIYGVSQDELRELNPEIQNGLKADMILKIPVKNKESKKNDEKAEKNDKKTEKVEKKSNKNNLTDSVTFISHKVKSKETLYSISRQYGVSVDEIKKHNPITQTYLREGSNLKIPIKKEKTESETIVNVPSSNPGSVSVNKTLISESVKTNKEPIRIAFLLPFMSQSGKVDGSTERFVDFYAGALIAIQQAKNNGVNLEILTLDVEKSDEKIIEVLQNNEQLKKMDMIIGPAYSNQVPFVTEYARENRIHTLIPFSSKVSDVNENPYVLQFNPGIDVEVKFVADHIAANYKSDNIIFADIDGVNFLDDGNEFAVALRQELDMKRIKYNRVSFKTDSPLPLNDLIQKNKKNIIFFNTDKYSNAGMYFPLISAFTEKGEIMIYEQYSWASQKIDGLGTFSVSAFKSGNKNGKYSSYKKTFTENFNWLPKSENPDFDLLGYDLTSYFIAMIYYNGNSFATDDNLELPASQGIQSELKFARKNENSGFVNRKLYLIEKK